MALASMHAAATREAEPTTAGGLRLKAAGQIRLQESAEAKIDEFILLISHYFSACRARDQKQRGKQR
jgi:hypothetical protein